MSPRAVIRSETKVLVKTWGLNPLEPVAFLRHLRTSYMVWSLMRLLIGLPFLRIGQKSGPGSSPRLEIQPFMASPAPPVAWTTLWLLPCRSCRNADPSHTEIPNFAKKAD
jgi:hypothetical protein